MKERKKRGAPRGRRLVVFGPALFLLGFLVVVRRIGFVRGYRGCLFLLTCGVFDHERGWCGAFAMCASRQKGLPLLLLLLLLLLCACADHGDGRNEVDRDNITTTMSNSRVTCPVIKWGI